jgi:hypothetical protein
MVEMLTFEERTEDVNASDKGSPKDRSVPILTAENIASRRVLRQGVLDGEGHKEMEWELIRRAFPQALLSWTPGS